jgi:dTDP-4-amino-4,6-dideoxygalactose transaminase
METLRALIRGDLPPVGSPITYFDSDRRAALPTFSGYCCHWVDSGTSALALAFLSAKSLRGEVASPEVIVPGYCCPDLLSAAHFAGFTPVIIDIEVDDPALNQQALKQVITENTVAIVAINFLGVTENIKMFEQLKLEYPRVFVVEDNAQWFPGEGELNLLFGDFVAFSFGRGKPVSLLGGGLLLVRSALPPAVVSSVKPQQSVGGFSSLELTLKYFAYNRFLVPVSESKSIRVVGANSL